MAELTRPRVLLSAYACNPCRGSEEGVGWGWVKTIAHFADPWVITADFHREDIEDYRLEHAEDLTNTTFVYVAPKRWHYSPTPRWKQIENSLAKPIMNLAYAGWLRDAGRLARQLHREQHFDLAHQLTYVGFRFPGRLWRLGIPFVWGPIGGLDNTPWRFLSVLGWRGAIYYGARNLVNSAQRLLLRAPRKALAVAGPGVIAATSGIQRHLRRFYGVDSHVVCEVGPLDSTHTNHSRRDAAAPLRLIWSGEHLPGKALPLLLDALANLNGSVSWRLDVLGEGPLTADWQRRARKLGLHGRCYWHGHLPRDQALGLMGGGHLFIITSLKDLTSTVLLEALSLGLPVICPDHCGFTDVVTKDCGIKLAVETPDHLVKDMAHAIEFLAEDEVRRRNLAQGALLRVQEYTWQKKAEEIEAVYKQVLAGENQGD